MMTIKADPSQFARVSDAVEQYLADERCARKPQTLILIAVDEILTNVANYAYPGGDGDVTIDFGVSDDTATISFTDTGVPYDPLSKPDPDISLTADERSVGGLGIFMVKKTMDDVVYKRADGKNILTIRKKIR